MELWASPGDGLAEEFKGADSGARAPGGAACGHAAMALGLGAATAAETHTLEVLPILIGAF